MRRLAGRRGAFRTGGSSLAAVLVLVVSAGARAFCRTTTCSPDDPNQPCSMGADGCITGGKPLYWPGACVSFSVQKNGSPLRHISEQTAEQVISAALGQWAGADCGGGTHPSIGIYDHGAVSCDKQEYNQHSGNANIFMFRDKAWPYDTGGSGASVETLALTTVTYNINTGEIYDADVEINSHDAPITVGDQNVQADLASILTHESGHFLGMAHTTVTDATMYPSYQYGDTSLRTLAQDDIDGICAIYPPYRMVGACDPTPRHGYATACAAPPAAGCGCSLEGSGERREGAPLEAALVALGLLLRRRRGSCLRFATRPKQHALRTAFPGRILVEQQRIAAVRSAEEVST